VSGQYSRGSMLLLAMIRSGQDNQEVAAWMSCQRLLGGTTQVSPLPSDLHMQHRRLADTNKHGDEAEICAENLYHPARSGIGHDCIRFSPIEEEVLHGRAAPVHEVGVHHARSSHREVVECCELPFWSVGTSQIAVGLDICILCCIPGGGCEVNLVSSELSIADHDPMSIMHTGWRHTRMVDTINR